MSHPSRFRLVQGFYWLGLGTWFGALAMLVIAAGITFRTVRQYQPVITVEPYNDPTLTGRAPDILAGGVVGNLLQGLARLQLICGAVVVVCVLLQCTAFADRIVGGRCGWRNGLRLVMIAGPLLVLAVDSLAVRPTIWKHRQVMYDPQQPQADREQAKARFDKWHKADTQLVGAAGLMLIGAVFASAFALHGDK